VDLWPHENEVFEMGIRLRWKKAKKLSADLSSIRGGNQARQEQLERGFKKNIQRQGSNSNTEGKS
jgi:hypothetical protein